MLIEVVDLVFVGQGIRIFIDLIVIQCQVYDRSHLLSGKDLGTFRCLGDAQSDDDQVPDQKERQEEYQIEKYLSPYQRSKRFLVNW